MPAFSSFPFKPAWIAAGALALVVVLLGVSVQTGKRRVEEARRSAEKQRELAAQAATEAQAAELRASRRESDLAQVEQQARSESQALAQEVERLRLQVRTASAEKLNLEERLAKAQTDSRHAQIQRADSLAAAHNFSDRLQMKLAEQAFAAGDPNRAVAILASLLRRSPGNLPAATRLLAALTDRSFALSAHPGIPVAANSEAFAMSADGKRVAVIAGAPQPENTVQIIQLESRTAPPLALAHSNRIEHLSFSPDGQRLAICANDVQQVDQGGRTALLPAGGYARIWDAASGRPLTGTLGHDVGVWSSSFNPAGNRLLTVGGDRAARVWDAGTGDPVTRPITHPFPIDRAFFSPDGSLIATVSERHAYTWDAQTGDGPVATLEHSSRVLEAQFTIDSKLLVVFPSDDKAVVWDPRTGESKLAAPFPLPNIAAIAGVRISPDGQRIAAAHTSGGAAIWDAFSGQSVAATPARAIPITRLQFSANGRLLASVGMDGHARLWDAHLGRPLCEPIPNLSWPFRLQFSPSGDRLALLGGAAGLEIRSALPGAARPLMLFSPAPLTSAAFSSDGTKVIAANANEVKLAWDARTGRRASLDLKASQPPTNAADIRIELPNTVFLETSPAGSAQSAALQITEPDQLRSAIGSSDGRLILAVMDGRETDVKGSYAGGAVQAFGPSGASLTRRLPHPNPIASAVVSPDGGWIATACLDREARVFQLSPEASPLPPLIHAAPVLRVVFSPDASKLLTLTIQNDLRIWDIASGMPISETRQQASKTLHLEFNPAGDQVLILNEAGYVELWDTPTAPGPAPDWLPDLAEWTVGQRNDGTSPSQTPNTADRTAADLRQWIANQPNTGGEFYRRWSSWFLGDRSTRAISPFSDMKTDQRLRTLIDENNFPSILEAVAQAPDNARALARLALLTLDEPAEDNIRRIGEADFYSLRALQLSPRDTEVIRIREIVTTALKQHRARN